MILEVDPPIERTRWDRDGVEIDDVRAYYDGVYFTEGRAYERPVRNYVRKLRLLRPEPGERLLDVSCGTGRLLVAARELGMAAVGVDLSVHGLKLAQAAGASPLACCQAELLPIASRSVDLVTCLGSLEHYLDASAAIAEMKRVLRPGGRLLIIVPNYYYWLNVLHVLFRGDHRTGHHQILERVDTYVGWRRFLEEEGLKVARVHQDRGQFPPVWDNGPLKAVIRMLRRGLSLLAPLHLAYQFSFVCKLPDEHQ